jgi:hypothetical protein
MSTRVEPEELEIGDNLRVIYIGGEEKFYTITSVDDIFYRDEHSSLAAGATESYAEVTNLDPPTGQLYWIGRIETECNVKIYLKQPAATNRWGTNKAPEGGLLFSDMTPILSGRRINLWIAEDYPPNVQLVNDTNVSITPVIYWIGKRFAVKEISKPSVYKTIKIGGISE